jgi:transcriptional regulator with XRE-family HTH domain
MYKNRNSDGSLNLCGKKLASARKRMIPKTSQRALADRLQLAGIDLDKNAIQRIEAGKRFVTDIELKGFSLVLGVSTDELLK